MPASDDKGDLERLEACLARTEARIALDEELRLVWLMQEINKIVFGEDGPHRQKEEDEDATAR